MGWVLAVAIQSPTDIKASTTMVLWHKMRVRHESLEILFDFISASTS